MTLVKSQNQELKDVLKENNIRYTLKCDLDSENFEPESTFITRGADNPYVVCENCDAEIQREKLNLHLAYCLKNIKKC